MAAGELALPDPEPVLKLLDAFRASKAMFAAVALGVFDRLERGTASAEALAAEVGAQAAALERLLRACVSLGLLTCDGKGFRNTPAAAVYLCGSSPHRLTGYVCYSDTVLWQLWAHLADAVREGGPRWEQAFGLEGPLWSHFFRTEEAKREFLMGMHGFGQLSSPRLAAAFDLSRFGRVVDLGGGTGHLAVALCRRYPRLRAVVFDLPQAIPLARELAGGTEVAERIDFVAGDFFADPLPEADLFAVGRVLHDWGDDKTRLLLRKIHDRLPAGGALLVAEKLLDDDKAGPPDAVLQSLNMLVVTEGRERTLGEYGTLLRGVGFASVEGRRTGSPLDAVLAVRAG